MVRFFITHEKLHYCMKNERASKAGVLSAKFTQQKVWNPMSCEVTFPFHDRNNLCRKRTKGWTHFKLFQQQLKLYRNLYIFQKYFHMKKCFLLALDSQRSLIKRSQHWNKFVQRWDFRWELNFKVQIGFTRETTNGHDQWWLLSTNEKPHKSR